MNNFFNKIKQSFSRLGSTRISGYSSDEFNRFLLAVSFVFFIIAIFSRRSIFYLITLVIVGFTYYRTFSKNRVKRYQENEKYLGIKRKITGSFGLKKKQFSDRKEYRYFKCPTCGQMVRVPRGKGHIRISCPKCGSKFERTV